MVLLGKVASVAVVIVTAKKNMITLCLASVLAEPFMVLLSPTSQPPHEAPSDPRRAYAITRNKEQIEHEKVVLNRALSAILIAWEYTTSIEYVY